MDASHYFIVFYVLFWVVRINGCVRRGRQPLLRGPEWFFNVPVPSDFYQGEGRRLLHRYWMRMCIPFAIDIPLTIAIFLSGRLALLQWLLLGLCALIHLNHVYSVDLAERQARPYAIPEAGQPVASVALSMKPRRLRDYSNPKMEWALAGASLIAFACLLRDYFSSPQHHNLRLVFAVPAVFTYLQLGMLLVKRLILAWRSPVPLAQAAEHLEIREETRRYYLASCDWYRAGAAAGILFWTLLISSSPAFHNRLMSIWSATWIVVSVAGTVLVEIRRKQLVKVALRARPVKLPDLLGQSQIARWPLCYQPSAPMLILKGPRGYSLNLANAFACWGAAYLLGLVALFALLTVRR